VTFTVGAPAPQVFAGGVLNAASYVGGPVSPGEIVTVFGMAFGTAADTKVFFDGLPATLLYVTPGQLSVTVPYSLTAGSTSFMIESQGQRSLPFPLQIASATPGIFTANASGKGQGAILNQDFSVNSAVSPAAKGSVAVLYGTGGGALTADELLRLALPVSVTVAGINAEVLYAGIAPGLVEGAIQVNVRIPQNAPSGDQPIVLQVGDQKSRSDVTLAVQ